MAVEPSDPRTREIARGVRSWNFAGPGTASRFIPEALEGCVLCRFSRRRRICRGNRSVGAPE
eukprot:4861356-Alexandrium_andersonii.AAC.1